MDKEKRQPDERRQPVHPLVALSIFFAVAVLSLGDLMEIIPIFAPVIDSTLFLLFHEIHDLLAVAVVLLAAYKHHTRLGITALLVYLAIHIPYFIYRFNEESPEHMVHMIEIQHTLFSSLIGLLGIWLINRLHKTETRYRSLFTGMLEGLAYCRMQFEGEQPQDFVYLEVNDQFEKLTGLHGVTGKRVTEVIPGIRETNPELFDIYGRVALSGKPGMFETYVPGLDMWFSISVYSPQKEYFIAVFDVITKRKRAEQRINHLTNVLRAIRNVNQLITHEKDRQNLIQESCNLLGQRKGYEAAWIVLLDEKRDCVAMASNGLGENAPAFRKQLETGNYPECVKELLRQAQSCLAYDQPGKRHNECVLASEHGSQDLFACKLEYEGKLYGVLGVAVPSGTAFDKEEEGLFHELGSDVSFALAGIESDNKRKQAEAALQTSEENFRHSVDYSPLGIRILNTDGETIYANRSLLDIYGFDTFEELKITPSKKVYTPESYAEHRKRVEKRQRGEYVPASYEIAVVNKDGNIRHLEVIRKEVLWDGKTQFQMLYRDITQVKQMQEQLIMQDRLASIGQLVSGVAHELNNPLTSVIGFSELLLQRELPDDVKADLQIVNDEAKRTSLIVKNLLTFARQQPQDKRAIGINEPIQTVLQLRRHEQSTNNIKVNTHFAPDLPQIMGNGSQLQQVFFNLTVNAEQAMLEAHKKGTLTITTEGVGNIVKVRFTDDGPGISPENMKRLFSPFFTTKGVGKGTGLGLSICQGIVTEHGGRIWAESEQGKGTSFIIELPAYNKPPQEARNKG